MFIHFGSYSYLGRGEWAFYLERWSKANYQTQVSARFNPVNFDAATVVGLAKTAGMRYLVITAKHHEGFAMWDSKVASFTDTTGGKLYTLPSYTPFKRDLLAELKAECDRQGIVFGLYYSILDWCHSSQTVHSGGFTTMASTTARTNYINDMKAHLQELLTRYDPALLWFDGDWCPDRHPQTLTDWWNSDDGRGLYNFLIGIKPNLVINERVKRNTGLGDYVCAERTVPSKPLPRPWETAQTTNGAWGYDSRKEGSYRPVRSLLRELVQVVSRDGNYLLNIGPRGDGVVTSPAVNALTGMGAWMSTYGDSIYGTTGSPYPAEPSWGYYTKKSGKLFAHVFTWPANHQLMIPSLTNTITRVYLLNNPGTSLRYTTSSSDITVSLPSSAPNADVSVVVVEVDGMPTAGPPPGGSGSTTYQAESGSVGGGTTIDSNNAGYTGSGFANFSTSGGWLEFDNVDGGGGGNATLTVRFANGSGGSRTGRLVVNGVGRDITFPATGSWTTWQTLSVTVSLTRGANTVRFESTGQDLANIDHIVVVTSGGTSMAPVITTQPASQTVAAGGSVTFSVTATGTEPLAYQWRHNGVAIPGATAASYTISTAQASHEGHYTVVVSNSVGSATSDPATLTVPASGGSTTYEAESGTIGGGTRIDSEHQGFTGTGYVNLPASGGWLQFDNVHGGAGGNATVTIRFANGSGSSRTGRLVVNGAGQNLTTPATSAWNSWQTMTVTVPLNSGTGNTIRFETNGNDLANIDHIVVATSG